jgi:non-heme chloroperoxidase
MPVKWSPLLFLSLLLLTPNISAQKSAQWHDPSPHKVQFVTVDKDVKLEVLDWGGTGRPIVLLAGNGNTAHVFDDFAPKLTSEYHVYGITRRGFGASSAPAFDATNYSADRLGDDVLAVMDALKIDKPVLVGHSLAGEEMTSVADRHPGRVAGLVYLEAGYAYAYYDSSFPGDILKDQIDLNELDREAGMVLSEDDKEREKHIADLLHEVLPTFERDLQQFDPSESAAPPIGRPPEATADDYKSYDAYRAYLKKTFGFADPEAELREDRQPTSDGHVGLPKAAPYQAMRNRAIRAGLQKYTEIKAPVLAIFAYPEDIGPWTHNDPGLQEFYASEADHMKRVTDSFRKGVPSAHVVVLPHAAHYVFLSNEADVLREVRAFTSGLK